MEATIYNNRQEETKRFNQDVESFMLLIFKKKYSEGTLEYVFIEDQLKQFNSIQIGDFYTFFVENRGKNTYFNEAGFSSLTSFKKAFVEFKEYTISKIWEDNKLEERTLSILSKLVHLFSILKQEKFFTEDNRIKVLENKLIGFKKKGTKDTLISAEEYKVLENEKFSELYTLFMLRGSFGLEEKIIILIKNDVTRNIFSVKKILELEIDILELPEKILEEMDNITNKF